MLHKLMAPIGSDIFYYLCTYLQKGTENRKNVLTSMSHFMSASATNMWSVDSCQGNGVIYLQSKLELYLALLEIWLQPANLLIIFVLR